MHYRSTMKLPTQKGNVVIVFNSYRLNEDDYKELHKYLVGMADRWFGNKKLCFKTLSLNKFLIEEAENWVFKRKTLGKGGYPSF